MATGKNLMTEKEIIQALNDSKYVVMSIVAQHKSVAPSSNVSVTPTKSVIPRTPLLQSTPVAGRTILTVSKQNYIQIINPTPVPMHIPTNTVLACVDVLHPQTIFTINDDAFDKKDSPDIANTQSSKAQEPINFDLRSSDLTETQNQELTAFLNQHRDVFANNLNELGNTNVFTHRIETGDSMPVRCQPYRAAPHIKKKSTDKSMNY
ncbi:hypothetical protein CHS0354_008258 [Potamilus streckersoni]|uniref:Uncharacterized protein n=1 Tax=Potamilus streckersoni TaxID=2493646 RepID=A0AAE0T750_9BIVA|nr:hypothetical protein CHS0354_008258 [Potamilus streckersoni]